MAVLEYVVVANTGNTFAEGWYIIEVDSCIIVCAESIFNRIGMNISENSDINMVEVKAAAEKAYLLINEGRNFVGVKKEEIKTKFDNIKQSLDNAKSELKVLLDNCRGITNKTSYRDR